MKFVKTINPVTKREQLQAQFQAKLISFSEREFENTNGTTYKIANVEFTDANGEIQRAGITCYEGNYSKGMTPGVTYAAVATKTSEGVFAQLSHLESAGRVTADMFGGFAEAEEAVATETKTTAGLTA